MKTLKKITLVFMLFIGTFAIVACEEEETSTTVSGDDCADKIEALVDIMLTKSDALSVNPTPANCEALKTAAINVLKAAKNCANGVQYEQAAQAWRDIDCSDFN